MKTRELYFIGGCSGVGKTTLVTPDLLEGKTRIHTGSIARRLFDRNLSDISEAIVYEIGKYEKAFLDTHYAATNIRTGHNIFYQGIEDRDLWKLYEIPRKTFVLVEGDVEEILQRRLYDSKERSVDYKQAIKDLEENRKNFFHYLKLTGATGHIIKNGDLDVARAKLLEIFI